MAHNFAGADVLRAVLKELSARGIENGNLNIRMSSGISVIYPGGVLYPPYVNVTSIPKRLNLVCKSQTNSKGVTSMAIPLWNMGLNIYTEFSM